MIGYKTGYRFGSWLVDLIPDRFIAWLARRPQAQRWALKDESSTCVRCDGSGVSRGRPCGRCGGGGIEMDLGDA